MIVSALAFAASASPAIAHTTHAPTQVKPPTVQGPSAHKAEGNFGMAMFEEPGWWELQSYMPNCGQGSSQNVALGAECYGYGLNWSRIYVKAWSQVRTCIGELITGGWHLINCKWWPSSPSFAWLQSGDTPDFHIAVRGRWYATLTTGRQLLGGLSWVVDSVWSAGVQAR